MRWVKLPEMGTFIRIDVDGAHISPSLGRALVELCPVDIYALEGERLSVRPDEEDECTLCELCLKAAPAGAIVIHKLYAGERLVSGGAAEARQS
jgi:NAD-dependent dihydropyrimidine dehydrogenase PreA subunit